MPSEPEVPQRGRTRTAAKQQVAAQATPVGFEPTRGDPIGLAGRRLSRSAKVSSDEPSGTSTIDVAVLRSERSPPPHDRQLPVTSSLLAHRSCRHAVVLRAGSCPPVTSSLLADRSCRHAVVLRAGSRPAWPHTHGCNAAGGCTSDTCGIRAHAGRPHRLSRPTP